MNNDPDNPTVAYKIFEGQCRVNTYCPTCALEYYRDEKLNNPVLRSELETAFDGMIPNCYSCCEEIK